jgi:hypothetical protein
VNVPFYSMVNLVAGRAVVRLMQGAMTGERLASEPCCCSVMRAGACECASLGAPAV